MSIAASIPAPHGDTRHHVEPGGPGVLLELDGVTVRKASVSSMDNNVYLITDAATGFQLLIDAADEPERLLQLVNEGGPRLRKIVTTHRHEDHTRALVPLSRRTRAWRVAGAEDAAALPVPTDRRVEHGDLIHLGEIHLEVIALRGHTPGSIALLLRPASGPAHLFSGDSLFPGGPGKTASPEDFAQLMDDLEERVFGPLGDDTVVHPGHGDSTTLGAERPQLAAWRQRGW